MNSRTNSLLCNIVLYYCLLFTVRTLLLVYPGTNLLKLQPQRAYCKIPGVIGVRIKKEGGQMIVLCSKGTCLDSLGPVGPRLGCIVVVDHNLSKIFVFRGQPKSTFLRASHSLLTTDGYISVLFTTEY